MMNSLLISQTGRICLVEDEARSSAETVESIDRFPFLVPVGPSVPILPTARTLTPRTCLLTARRALLQPSY